jgi:hypothetical protein
LRAISQAGMIADSEARAALRSFWIPAAEPTQVLGEEREEINRRFPHFTRKDYSALITELQKLVKAAIDQTKV